MKLRAIFLAGAIGFVALISTGRVIYRYGKRRDEIISPLRRGARLRTT